MINPSLSVLTDYPFDRLRALLDGIAPPRDRTPIMMSLGEPQHDTPALVAETVARHAAEWNRYPPVDGTEDVRVAVTEWLTRRYGLRGGMVDADKNVIAVSGTREALFLSAMLCMPKEKDGRRPLVLMPNPFYQVYLGAAVMNGADPLLLAATEENGFQPSIDSLGEETLKRTAMLYICSPSNPQGSIAGMDYLKKAIELARRYDFVVAFDECYSEIYGETPPPGGLEACKELGGSFDNVLVFNSLSKRSSAPGLRSGFMAGDEKLIAMMRRLRSYAGATLPRPILAASAALWKDEVHVEENREKYREKFDVADRILSGRFGFYRPGGGFFLWLNVGDGETAAKTLWEKAAVRSVPGAYFAREDDNGINPGAPYIRLALVQDKEIVEEGLTRLRDVL